MKVRTLKDVEEMCRVVSGVKELSGTAIKDGRKPRKLSSHDDLPLFVSRIRYPGTQGTHTHNLLDLVMFVLHLMRDAPNASEIQFIFEDTSVDVKIHK